MEIKRLRTLAIEIFKTINKINLSFMKDIFTHKRDPKMRPFEIFVKHRSSAKYSDKSLIPLGPKIWNQLPSNVKTLTSITKFKEYTRCKCNICRMILYMTIFTK